MGIVSIILRRPPYGTVDASEAIRHVLGGITEDLSINLILVDGGVNAARKQQETSDTGYLSAETGIKDCIDMGAAVYADKNSLMEEHIGADTLVEGVVLASGPEIAEIIKKSETAMIF
ncbi:MAG TPA: DsrE family protein [Nitrospirota bacterium]|nr:DsrE family protein [Nitrospirota bacterium]